MDELVSIIITTYARTGTLRRAINSVLGQTYKNIEIIVVDDNIDIEVRNQVKEIIKTYDNEKIKLICNKCNLGGALARNEGIKAASGNYVAFLDDDDEYLPNKIYDQYELFKNSVDVKLALVYGYCKEIKSNGKVIEYKYNYTGNCVLPGMIDCIAATSQWMCKKDALMKVGMFSNVPCKQDSTVILKLLIAGYTVERVPKFLSIYHTDQAIRISNGNHQKRIAGEEQLLKLCREHYYLLSSEEQKEVEYSFACRLAEHYFAVGNRKAYIGTMKTILKKPITQKSLATYKHIMSKLIVKLKQINKKVSE